jgi:hypothetical protein
MTGVFNPDDRYYDRDTNPITLHQWAALRERDDDYYRVDETMVGPYRVSTVWMGLDHALPLPGHLPLIFETMVFDTARVETFKWGERNHSYSPEVDDLTAHYTTEAQARAGHKLIVEKLQVGGTGDE